MRVFAVSSNAGCFQQGFRFCSKVVDNCKRNGVGFMELLTGIGYLFCTKICFCLYIIIYALRNSLLI